MAILNGFAATKLFEYGSFDQSLDWKFKFDR